MTLNMMQKHLGLNCIKDCIILPFATGMSLTISMLALKSESDKLNQDRKYVIFPRIDQKTCLKSIYTSNLQPIVVEPIVEGDELRTNIDAINTILESDEYKDKVLCVLSTTSCFAPRAYDSIVEIAKICKEKGINHIINSAYGLQCSKISSDVVEASKKGTVDVIVSSTDKNFMVPVGGSIIYSPHAAKTKDGAGII